MRVVLDSNVLVAAFATHGVCHEVFEYCLRNAKIICSDFISKEVQKTLTHKIKVPSRTVSEIIQFLKSQSEWIIPNCAIPIELRDPNDYSILAAAISGRADYLISGDRDLLVLKEVKKISILSPKEFWILCQGDK